MPGRVSESLVIRSFPFGEADLIVSYLTRDQGKMRGVAKRARRPKSSFGAGLERLSHVRMVYYQKENRELTTLDSCELIRSPFTLLANYETGIALDYMAELTEELLPQGEPSEKHFRLLLSVLDYLQAAKGDAQAVWPATIYFALWAVRLAGFGGREGAVFFGRGGTGVGLDSRVGHGITFWRWDRWPRGGRCPFGHAGGGQDSAASGRHG